PHYAPKRFDKWFEKRLVGSARCADWTPQRRVPTKKRGKVILWDDTFARYHEPHIGIAAVKVLGVLGFDVSLAKKRRCCGRPAFRRRLAERLPGRKATVLDTGCCGMAGAFGALAEKYDLSVRVAAHLIDQIDNQPPGTEIVASGTSCRHQIADLTNARPKHMAELLAEALA